MAELEAKDASGAASAGLPSDAVIIVPVRNTVLFPGMVLPISVGRPGSIAAAQQAVREQRQIGILMQRDQAKRSRAPATFTASARLPIWCVTSPPPTATTI